MMMLMALFSLGLCVLVKNKNNYCRLNLSVLLFRQVI